MVRRRRTEAPQLDERVDQVLRSKARAAYNRGSLSGVPVPSWGDLVGVPGRDAFVAVARAYAAAGRPMPVRGPGLVGVDVTDLVADLVAAAGATGA